MEASPNTELKKDERLDPQLEPPAAGFGDSPSGARLLRLVRLVSWVIIAGAGLLQAWFERHKVFSDGVSYLDIAAYYAKGDWHSALNSYWSPLYSWILALLMVVFRPSAYWQVSLMHIVNYLSLLAALLALDAILDDLARFRQIHIGRYRLSEFTMRAVSYSVFLVASLEMIDTGCNSPDMVAMAILFYLTHLLLRIESGRGTTGTYLLFGAALGVEFLCRAAFAPFAVLYTLIAAALLWRRHVQFVRPTALVVLATVLVSAPFVVALSLSKGRFTMGDAGKLNYGWEVDGAARSVHWQGEPYDIGKPIHPTHKVLSHPPTYTFASPVPGSYPPWYEPSYFYEGIKPHLKFKPQLAVFVGSFKYLVYIFLRSPVTLPVLLFSLFMGWRRWFSGGGLLAFWFLLLPTVLYMLAYTLVFMDSRYVASSLIISWICLVASLSIRNKLVWRGANVLLQVFAVVFALTFLFSRMRVPARTTAGELVHLQEKEWNLNWMVADQLIKFGLKPSDRIAWIGESINAEWVRLANVKTVAEVPVIWGREQTLFRRVFPDQTLVKEFWQSTPEQQAAVFKAFRDAGATIVVVDRMPEDVDHSDWTRVLSPDNPHLTRGLAQFSFYQNLYFKRIAPAP